MNPLDTLEIGKMYEIKDSPFTQVPQHFIGYWGGTDDDIATFYVPNETTGHSARIRFSAWDLANAMEYGEITIIER